MTDNFLYFEYSNYMKFIDKILNCFRDSQADPRYETRFFSDERMQFELCSLGYTVEKGAIDPTMIQSLLKDFEKISGMLDHKFPDSFVNSGRLESAELRNFVTTKIHEATRKDLSRYFDTEIVDITTGCYQIKPPHSNSLLNPHQDSSMVDEEKYFGIHAWIPLVDVTPENGTLYVLPGSHRFGNSQRSLNVPWPFSKFEKLMLKYSIPVTLKAGDVVFFENSTIHYSPPNTTSNMRLAVTVLIKPKNAPLIHHFIDDKTPSGMVELYEVNADFWNNYDIMKRPPAQFPFLGYRKHKKPEYTFNEFEEMCRKHSGLYR